MSHLRFKARVENGVLVPTEDVDLDNKMTPGATYWITLELENEPASEVDALAELAALAQPLGPPDLARNFDTYTGRVLGDKPTE